MNASAASNLLSLHAGICIGGWVFGGPAVLLLAGAVVAALNIAMFRCNKIYEGE